MTFGRRKDGHFYRKDSGVSSRTFAAVAAQDRQRSRLITRAERARLATLENPLLYSNFIKKMEKLNPSFDEQLVDKSLEPEEALMDLKRKYPELDIGLKTEGQSAEFRAFLDDFGITNEKVQNMVAMEPNPLSDEELANLGYVLNNRPENAVKTDNAIKAPITNDVRRWMAKPNRLDLQGVDAPKRRS